MHNENRKKKTKWLSRDFRATYIHKVIHPHWDKFIYLFSLDFFPFAYCSHEKHYISFECYTHCYYSTKCSPALFWSMVVHFCIISHKKAYKHRTSPQSSKSVCETRKENKEKKQVSAVQHYIIVIQCVYICMLCSYFQSDTIWYFDKSTNVILGIRAMESHPQTSYTLNILVLSFSNVDNKVILYEKCGEFL